MEEVGPLRPAPAHPHYRLRRLWMSAYAGGFVNVNLKVNGGGLIVYVYGYVYESGGDGRGLVY